MKKIGKAKSPSVKCSYGEILSLRKFLMAKCFTADFYMAKGSRALLPLIPVDCVENRPSSMS